MALKISRQVKPQRPLQVNMTSMVDIVFLLIIFFVLVSQFISAENIMVELPQPDKSQAKNVELPERVVLNCQYVPGRDLLKSSVRYRLGPIQVEDVGELESRLRAARTDRPDVQVIVRADRKIRYRLIRDAMQAIARAGIRNMNIAAEVED